MPFVEYEWGNYSWKPLCIYQYYISLILLHRWFCWRPRILIQKKTYRNLAMYTKSSFGNRKRRRAWILWALPRFSFKLLIKMRRQWWDCSNAKRLWTIDPTVHNTAKSSGLYFILFVDYRSSASTNGFRHS